MNLSAAQSGLIASTLLAFVIKATVLSVQSYPQLLNPAEKSVFENKKTGNISFELRLRQPRGLTTWSLDFAPNVAVKEVAARLNASGAGTSRFFSAPASGHQRHIVLSHVDSEALPQSGAGGPGRRDISISFQPEPSPDHAAVKLQLALGRSNVEGCAIASWLKQIKKISGNAFPHGPAIVRPRREDKKLSTHS